MSDFLITGFCNSLLFCVMIFSLIWILFSAVSMFEFIRDKANYNDDRQRFSSDSKDFKIDDPVVYNDHGDDYFTHINGVYSWEEKLCYALEAA